MIFKFVEFLLSIKFYGNLDCLLTAFSIRWSKVWAYWSSDDVHIWYRSVLESMLACDTVST